MKYIFNQNRKDNKNCELRGKAIINLRRQQLNARNGKYSEPDKLRKKHAAKNIV